VEAATLTGRTIAGRYVVERLAGEGGMGAIYRATDSSTGAPVAMKVLSGAFRDAVERFEREARVLASLEHPGIVRHVDHGRTEDGSPFLAMEWLEGEDLAQRLERGPLPIDQAVAMVSQAARALGEVHARGIVHRDVKPSNVFLRDGMTDDPVLLDFGIALQSAATLILTRPGNVLGTPQYMSPEQVRGDRDLDPRSDVFALGCVLFECIAGRPAFTGEHAMAVLAKILLEHPPALSELVPEVGQGLSALVRTMLDKRVDARPSSCLAIADQLAAASIPASKAVVVATELTKRERRLVAVVLARDVKLPVDRTLSPEAATSQDEELGRSIEALGGQLAMIGSSNVVVLVPPAAAATDQATSAARCAQLVARTLPDASVALAMGWAEVDPMPVGEVIDRAAAMLAGQSGSGIRVDDVSAGLLELRFELEGDATARRLGAERSSAEAPRTLLGKPTPCVGRDRELAVLLGLMGEVASDGVARVAHVTAPAGVGKSRLRHELCTRIAREHGEALVLVARAEAFRANASLDMIGQIVREAAGIRADETLDAARSRLLALASTASVTGHDSGDIAALLGEIASVPFEDSASARLAAARRDNRVIGELMLSAWLGWVGAEVRTRPVVLVFEDLHWGDAQTVRYVDAALRDLVHRPLFVLAFSRPDVRERFPTLWSGRSLQEVALPPLTPRAAERLVRAALGDLGNTSVERIVEQSEGHPLYIEEMIRAVASGAEPTTSGTVLAMIQSRVESFDAPARRVMRAASVFGESFRIEDVHALVGNGEEVDAVVDLLAEREVIARRPNETRELAFRHALLREAAYAMLTDEDRERAHRLAAGHLETRGGADDVVLAEDYDLGKDPERAATWYASAARQALRKNDFDAAIAHANACLARGGTPEVRAIAIGARGKARACKGSWMEAERDLLEALRLAPDMDATRRMDHLEDLWFVAIFRQDAELMRRAGTEARALAEAGGRADVAAEASIALALADHADGACDASLTRFRLAFGSTRERPSLVVGLASIVLYHAAAHAECEAVTRKMLTVAAELGDASTQIILTANLGVALAGQGHYAEALDSFERARSLATKYGITTLLTRAVSMSTGYPLDVYDFDEAERRATETRELGRAIEFSTPRINASLDLAYVAARRGQIDRALALVAATGDEIAAGRGFHGWIWRSRLAVLYAEIFAARGEWDLALLHSEACIHGCTPLRRLKYRLLAEHVRARSLAALGRREEGIAAARASLDEARLNPDPAMLLRAAAVLLDLDRDTRALSDLADAAARIERGLPSEVARSAFRGGAPLARLG
jgi:tetratricopeptide (TPR) repeat protein